jgi:hypothetical protein
LSIVSNEYDSFRNELQPQLENARREIELNKSMLDMLNNEIQMLNSEKLQLEKRLFITRRQMPPSVIIEEDEEDLEEEERTNNQQQQQPCQVQRLNSIKEEEDLYNHNNDIQFLNNNNINHLNSDGILILNKHVEDLTFYVDELKSELEAEREKNNEYFNDIKEYRKQIEDFEEQHEFNMNELRLENDRLQKECVDALLNVTEKEKQIALLISTQNNSKEEELVTVDNNNNNKLEIFTNILINEIIDKQNYDYDFRLNSLNENELNKINILMSKLKTTDNGARVKLFEEQMERIIKDFKEEIHLLEIKVNEKENEFNNLKQQVFELFTNF